MIGRYIFLMLALIIAMPVIALAGLSPQELEKAKGLYERYCSQCHGEEGRGDGPGADFFDPRPRDFTFGWYKFRSTKVESLPTDDDLFKTVTDGLPGTGMPGFGGFISDEERRLLAAYIKGFSERFKDEKPLEPLKVEKVPPITDESIKRGKKIFEEELECKKCHGLEGRADGPSVPGMVDDWEFPIRPRNFHKGWTFRRGSSREAIFNTVYNGITGTPMPSFRDSFEDPKEAVDKIWDVTNYVFATFVKEKPNLKQAIKVRFIKGDIPLEPDSELWKGVEGVDIPLVGQVIIKPRYFNPSIDMVTVKGLHNGEEMALLIQWDDNSESDPSKPPAEDGEVDTNEGDVAVEEDGGEVEDMGEEEEPLLPDRLIVQFPAKLKKGSTKPYFIGGDSRNPVYLWSWQTDKGVSEIKATGLGKERILKGVKITSKAFYKDGQWSLILKRRISLKDKERLDFVKGAFIPVAFNAMDGSEGETGTRRSISTWYYIVLEAPMPIRVYLFPPLVFILGVFFEIWLMKRVRKGMED